MGLYYLIVANNLKWDKVAAELNEELEDEYDGSNEEGSATYMDRVESTLRDEGTHDYDVIERAIESLTPTPRKVLGYMMQDYTLAETAKELGASRQYVHQEYVKALEGLRRALKLRS